MLLSSSSFTSWLAREGVAKPSSGTLGCRLLLGVLSRESSAEVTTASAAAAAFRLPGVGGALLSCELASSSVNMDNDESTRQSLDGMQQDRPLCRHRTLRADQANTMRYDLRRWHKLAAVKLYWPA